MAKTEIDVVIKGKDKASGVLKKLGQTAKGLGIGIGAIGVAAVGMGVAAVKGFTEAGDAVQKMAQRTGFSTVALSELKHAAELSGSSLEGLETGFKKMARFVDDAKQGLSTATDVMDTMGISVEDFAGLSPEDTFTQLSTAIAEMEDPLAKQNAAMELFGRAGTDMLPMLAQGAEGLAAMKQEAHDLGIVFTQDAADSAANFNDSLTKMQGVFTGLMNELAMSLMPILEALIPVLTDIVKALPLKQFAELIKKLLPPLVTLFVELLQALPIDKLVELVNKGMGPMMTILSAIAKLASPLIRLLEPVLDLLILILDVLTPVIEALAWVIETMASGLGKGITAVTGFFSDLGGGGKKMAAGGIVTGPTRAIIGEAGPEAVIPLRGGGLGDTVNVIVEGSIWAFEDLTAQLRTEFLKIKADNTSTGF
ncbi:hypothetical protein CMI37_02745 [Candidatus Pacearchaeota archaeon]|nr:hypothetical protein [Candidatus Pacearchaeota archaeon]